MISVAIHGAAGRMGCRLIALIGQDSRLELVAAIESESHPKVGEDSGLVAGSGANGIVISSQWPRQVDVAIDFSTHHAVDGLLRHCRAAGVPLVMATTGLTDVQLHLVQDVAKEIPLLFAPNMSLAVNLAMKLAETTARVLAGQGQDVDVEIIERHHHFKADAPSGTALKFGQLIAGPLGLRREVHGRHGQVGQRGRDEIGYHAVRVGDDPGQHTIIFALHGESLELKVAASTRDCYAVGALAAARFLSGRNPGLYTMDDVLGWTDVTDGQV